MVSTMPLGPALSGWKRGQYVSTEAWKMRWKPVGISVTHMSDLERFAVSKESKKRKPRTVCQNTALYRLTSQVAFSSKSYQIKARWMSLWKKPLTMHALMKVIVIGAGISGFLASIRFPRRIPNLDLVVYDKNSEVGGTWFENLWWYDAGRSGIKPHHRN